MKKILLTVALLAVAVAAGAQNKDQLQASIAKAQEATLNEKKAANPATWIKYGDALTKAYLSLYGDARTGWDPTTVMLMTNGKQPLSEEQVAINGTPYIVQHFEFHDMYYDANSIVAAIIITQHISDENLLVQARDAYLKAAELDAKGSKTRTLTDKLLTVEERLVENASSCFAIGRYEEAAELFEASIMCRDNNVINSLDTVIVSNTALAYNVAGNNAKAREYYELCVELGYDENGENSSALADILIKEGDTDAAKACLNSAFQKYPSSQAVLVALINLYMETNDDPNKILDLIHHAQVNEPTNASLVYAEGNVYFNMNDYDNAIRCYYKSFEMDPTYVYGIYAVGNAYFEHAVDVQDEMDKLDLSDIEGYDKLLAEFEGYLTASIEPFETAISLAGDDNQDVKVASASALKQVYFRFRDKDPKYAEGYDRCDAILKEAGVE
ncbi:MAG TPA: tetratricopeptide repeat protein [Candidatus Coprenecus stercoravium]|uniref:Tetratricopeptide repeat protein n=1 Tax=Candidatus Coprenecus stercoravium TaxID=2840735 RepID=A0A9D2K9I4_9BACT|nr:tetratricopeptide repeat protein [Candidatus Coprenecus stercoravium]